MPYTSQLQYAKELQGQFHFIKTHVNTLDTEILTQIEM